MSGVSRGLRHQMCQKTEEDHRPDLEGASEYKWEDLKMDQDRVSVQDPF